MKGKKTGGRIKGSLNRTSEEIRQALLRILDNNLSQLQDDLQAMEPKDRATILISLAKHCTAPALNPEKLSIEQLEQIIEYLRDHEKQS